MLREEACGRKLIATDRMLVEAKNAKKKGRMSTWPRTSRQRQGKLRKKETIRRRSGATSKSTRADSSDS